MIQTFVNAWKVPELRKKLLFTLMIILLYRIGANHELISTEVASLKAFTDRVEFGGDSYDFKGMDGMAIYSRNALVFHHEKLEGHLEVKSDIGFNALKYLYLYQMTKETK